MPSRAAANADGTPSIPLNQAKGSTGAGLVGIRQGYSSTRVEKSVEAAEESVVAVERSVLQCYPHN